jgi:arabinan endo-1,5-alpha-L-arabinosidase
MPGSSLRRRPAWKERARFLLPFLTVLVGLTVLAPLPTAAAAGPRHPAAGHREGTHYRNPVIPSNTPDPSIIRGLDGYYYLYTTTVRLGTSRQEHMFPIWRSANLVNWTYVGDALHHVPSWIEGPQYLGSPDVHYFNGRYYMYFSENGTKALPKYNSPAATPAGGVSAIGVLTAPTPAGPWKDAGPSAGGSYKHGPLLPPEWGFCTDPRNPACYNWEFDPYVYTAPGGQRYLYEGSFFGGNRVYELSASGTQIVPNSALQIGHNIRYEANYLIPHVVAGKVSYLLLNSESDCCVGANTPYSVVADRSSSPTGPFSDQNGAPMEWFYGAPTKLTPGESPLADPIWYNLAGEAGGFPVVKQSANGWVGAGGQAAITDLAGQDWLVYVAINQNHPWADNAPAGTAQPLRQLFIDPLDWTKSGWPVVNNGNGPTLAGKSPVTTPEIGDNFNVPGFGAPNFGGRARARWQPISGRWQTGTGIVSGGFLRQGLNSGEAELISTNAPVRNQDGLNLECSLRSLAQTSGTFGCGLATAAGRHAKAGAPLLDASIDPATRQLTVTEHALDGTIAAQASAALPADVNPSDWHQLVVKVNPLAADGPHVTAELDLPDGNPVVIARIAVSQAVMNDMQDRAEVALITDNARAAFDNVSLSELAQATGKLAAPAAPGQPMTALSSNFGGKVGGQFAWLRNNPGLRGFAPDGALSITSNGSLDEYQRLNLSQTNPPELSPTQDVLLEPAPKGNYVVETRMHFDPQTPNQEAGIIIYSDDDTNVQNVVTWNATETMVADIRNMLTPLPPTMAECPLAAPMTGANVAVKQYSHSACPPMSEHTSQEYPASLRCCFVANGQGPSGNYPGGDLDPARITVWLRIYRKGDTYTPWFSLDGHSWTREDAWTLRPSSKNFPIRIGLFAQNNQQTNVQGAEAWFDYFKVSATQRTRP